MKNIYGLVILIVLVVVLLAVWGKLFPENKSANGNSTDGNPIEKGTQAWTEGIGTGVLTGAGNSVGGFEAGVLNGVKVLWDSVFGTKPAPDSGGAAGSSIQAVPLPYGNPIAGLDQPGSSSDGGGDFLPQAWPLQ